MCAVNECNFEVIWEDWGKRKRYSSLPIILKYHRIMVYEYVDENSKSYTNELVDHSHFQITLH